MAFVFNYIGIIRKVKRLKVIFSVQNVLKHVFYQGILWKEINYEGDYI